MLGYVNVISHNTTQETHNKMRGERNRSNHAIVV